MYLYDKVTCIRAGEDNGNANGKTGWIWKQEQRRLKERREKGRDEERGSEIESSTTSPHHDNSTDDPTCLSVYSVLTHTRGLKA